MVLYHSVANFLLKYYLYEKEKASPVGKGKTDDMDAQSYAHAMQLHRRE
jgi:hypothetical protein